MNESDIVKMCFKERKEKAMLKHSEGNVGYDLVCSLKEQKDFPQPYGHSALYFTLK